MDQHMLPPLEQDYGDDLKVVAIAERSVSFITHTFSFSL